MTTYAFTSASANYLPKVRVLAESIKSRTPGVRFCVVLAEPRSICAGLSLPKIDEIVSIEDLAIPRFRSWLFQHTLVETCTAIKAFFLERLLQREDCAEVFYFDPDIVVLCDLAALAEPFARGSILLTPHLTTPDRELDSIRDNEIAALRHGAYNLGFLGVRNGDSARRFAAWWRERLLHFCHDDIPAGLFTDQRWLDLAPGFFDAVAIVRDPTWNVATWNLGHRQVEGSLASGLAVNGRPLRFFHFSGLDSGAQLAMLEKYGAGMPALLELRDWYLRRCAELEDTAPGTPEEAGATAPWTYDRFDDGSPITRAHRRLYRHRDDLQRTFPDPFAAGQGGDSYSGWYRANRGEHAAGAGATFGETTASPGSPEEMRELAAFYRAELDSLHRSRAWRLFAKLRAARARWRRWTRGSSRGGVNPVRTPAPASPAVHAPNPPASSDTAPAPAEPLREG